MTAEVVIAAIILGAQIGLRFFFKKQETGDKRQEQIFRILFWSSVIVIVIVQGYWLRQQFLLWYSSGPPSSYLVPPYVDISYFLLYGFTNFFMKPLIALGAALALLIGAKFLNRRRQNIFFEPEEPHIAASALFLAGHPGWLYTFSALIVAYLLIHVTRWLLHKKQERIPLYWFWLPFSISAIIFTYVSNSG